MKKKIIFLTIAFVLILFCLIKNGGKEMEYNNIKEYSELATYSYSIDKLLDIQNEIINGENIRLTEIVENKNIECVRNIENSRYLLLISETGEKLFIFFDEKQVIKYTYFVNEFLEQSEFENVQKGNTRLSEIIKIDSNCFMSPVSTIEATVHIVKEGIIVVKYSRMQGTTILQDPIVESIEFCKNDEILKQREQDILIKVAPYILPIDKYY